MTARLYKLIKSLVLSSTYFAACLVAILYMPNPALALKEEKLDRYSSNSIYFYDPDECNNKDSDDNNSNGGSTDGSGSSSSLSEQQVAFVRKYHAMAEKLSIQYGIPWETVIAQGILESTSGTTDFATKKNNFFGIGAYDSCPWECAFSYATEEEGWEGYYKNIVKTETYRKHGVFQGDTITNPYSYAVAIKNAGYATDPNYVKSLSSIISGIETLSKEEGWLSSAELAAKYPEMKTNAAKNAQGENAEVTTDSSTAEDTGGNVCPDDDNLENGVTFATYDGVKYAFPLMYASKEASSGNGFLSTMPCNHDIGCHYGPGSPAGNAAAAFDICFNNKVEKRQCVGAKVVSMSDGYITRVTYTRNNEKCNHVRIRSKSDNYIIAYMHMAYDDSIVDGVDVKAGDLIGEVSGTGACHDNSTPHVHIDMGSDTQATGGPTESERNPKITKIMNAVYGALPDTEEELQERMKSNSSISGLTDDEAKAIADYYNSDAVTASEWDLPSTQGKWNCVSFSAFFVQKFTSIGKTGDRVWGNGRDVTDNLRNDYKDKIKVGSELKPFSVFSVTQGSLLCGDAPCGHTGIVVRVDGDEATTIETAYGVSNSAKVTKRKASYFVNKKHEGEEFAYLSDILNTSEVKSITNNKK